MPETQIKPSAATPNSGSKSKFEKTHSVVHTVSMTTGIIGAIGAGCVWLMANLYVGDVEIQTDRPVDSLLVKVYDKRGQEGTFHMGHFQLMPGSYHLEVTPGEFKSQHADIEVKFAQRSFVPIAVKDDVDDKSAAPAYKSPKEHWWQFWRK